MNVARVQKVLYNEWGPLLDLADTYHDMLSPMTFKRVSNASSDANLYLRCKLPQEMDFPARKFLFLKHVKQMDTVHLKKAVGFLDSAMQKSMNSLTLEHIKDVKKDLRGIESYEDWVMTTYQDVMLKYVRDRASALELQDVSFQQLPHQLPSHVQVDIFIDALQGHDILRTLHACKRYRYVSTEWDAAVTIPGALLLKNLVSPSFPTIPTIGHTGESIQFRDEHVVLKIDNTWESFPIEFVRLLQLSVHNLCSLMRVVLSDHSLTSDHVCHHLIRNGKEVVKLWKKKSQFRQHFVHLDKLTAFIAKGGITALLDMKRSGDYGQIATVKQVNVKYAQEKKKQRLYLVTIDRLCYLRAKHEHVPCMLVKSLAKTVTLYHGEQKDMDLFIRYYMQKLGEWQKEIGYFLREIMPLLSGGENTKEPYDLSSLIASPWNTCQVLSEQIMLIVESYADISPSIRERRTHFERLVEMMDKYQSQVKENINKWQNLVYAQKEKRGFYRAYVESMLSAFLHQKIPDVYLPALEPEPDAERITQLIPHLEKDRAESGLWMQAIFILFLEFDVRKHIITFPWSESNTDTFELPYVTLVDGLNSSRTTRLQTMFHKWTHELGIGLDDHVFALDTYAHKTLALYNDSGHPAPTGKKRRGGEASLLQDNGFKGMMTHFFHHLGVLKSLAQRDVVRISRHELDPVKSLLSAYYEAVGRTEMDGDDGRGGSLERIAQLFERDQTPNLKKQKNAPTLTAGSQSGEGSSTHSPTLAKRRLFKKLVENQDDVGVLRNSHVWKDVIYYYFTREALSLKKVYKWDQSLSVALTWFCCTLLLIRICHLSSTLHTPLFLHFMHQWTYELLVLHDLVKHKSLMDPDFHVNNSAQRYVKEIEGMSFLSAYEKQTLRKYIEVYNM